MGNQERERERIPSDDDPDEETRLREDQIQQIMAEVIMDHLKAKWSEERVQRVGKKSAQSSEDLSVLTTSHNWANLPASVTSHLKELTPEEAEKLLLEISPRIGTHARQLAILCGYESLALQVSAGLLNESNRDVADYIEQLRAEALKYKHDSDNLADLLASVEATLRLSFDSLDSVGQNALCQLSVFPTSFDLAAANAIVVGVPIEKVLELLHRRRLVEMDVAAARYTLHEAVRAFGALRLENANAVQRRFAKHYVQIAKHAGGELYLKGDTSAALALFDRERTNIDTACAWAREQAGDREADKLLLEHIVATGYIGTLRYDVQRERIPQLDAALLAARRLNHKQGEAIVLNHLGAAYDTLGDSHKAIAFYEQALSIHRDVGDTEGEGVVLGNLGSTYNSLGETEKAIIFHEQARVISQKIGDQQGEAIDLGNLGAAYRRLGEVDKAITHYEQALVIARKIGDKYHEANTLGNLGNAYMDLDEIHKAIGYYEQALAITQNIGDRRGQLGHLYNLGNAYSRRGEFEKAITFYENALIIIRQVSDQHTEAQILSNLGDAYDDLGQMDKAISYHEQALAVAREIGDQRLEGIDLSLLGSIYAKLGMTEKAVTHFEQALAIAHAIGDQRSIANRSWYLGEVVEKQGDLKRAVALMQICVDYERETGHADAEKDAMRVAELRQRVAAQQSTISADNLSDK